MASSGSFQTKGYSDSAGSPDYCTFSWSIASQSIEGNYSVINWSLSVGGGKNANWYNTIKERYVTVNGATQSNTTDKTTVYNGTVLFSGSTTIYHNADGNKSFTASAGAAFEYYGAYNSTGSGSWDLPQIPRATNPTISATSVTMGNSITITLSPASTGFKHKIRYSFGSLSNQTTGLSVGAEFTASGNATVTFTPPTSLANQIPSANSGTCTIYIYTYNSSGTQIGGTTSKTVALNVPAYSLTGSVALTGNNLRGTAYVQGKSTVTAKITAGASYGATIKSYSSTVDGKTYSGQSFTSSVLSSGSKTVTVTITDSRNKTLTFNSTAFTVYAYAVPYITSFTVERQSDGSSVKATLVGGISALNNQNTKSFTVTLNGVTNTINSSAYTINATTTFTNVPTDSTLTATATIKDYYSSISKDATLPTVAVTMDFLYDGKGVAFGKVAETTDTLEVAWQTKLNKATSIEVPAFDSFKIKRVGSGNAATIMFANENGKLGYIGMTDNADGGLKRWKNDTSGNYLILDTGNTGAYVEEQGISNDWNYLKWSNGRSEAWRKIELGDVPLTTSLAGGVYSNTSYNARGLTLPSGVFTTIPLAFANAYSNGYTLCQVASATNTQIVYRIWSPYSATVTGCIVSLYVVGKWK